MRAKGGAGDRQTMVENLVDIDWRENNAGTAGEPLHPVKERGDAVSLLDNHPRQFSIASTKISLQQLRGTLDAGKRVLHLMRQ